MTDNFLQKLEEKVMILLAELEALRLEVSQLKQENSTLTLEKLSYTKSLQKLISLLDSLDITADESTATYQLEIMNGPEEYAMA
jgi:regulator of replication initiation timing